LADSAYKASFAAEIGLRPQLQPGGFNFFES